MTPCPDVPCDECMLRDCETHVTYVQVPGVPLTPKCSDEGRIFVPNGKGGGFLFTPLRGAGGKVAMCGGKAVKGRRSAKVVPWSR